MVLAVLQNVWWLLVLIGVMILIHELGHYWAARFFDVRVEAFSFGFGPRLFGFRKGETDFRFSLILFGGYVKMAGEQPEDGSLDDPRSFLAKPRWQRLVIAAAGPTMNIVLAVALLTGLFMFRYPKPLDADSPAMIGHVLPDTPAAKAGILEGDRIVALDGVLNPNWEDVLMKEVANANQPLSVVVERGGAKRSMVVTPALDERTGVGAAGWTEQSEIQIAAILPKMDAERKGLRAGDVLVSVNGRAILSPYKLHDVIEQSAGNPVDIIYARNGVRNRVLVQPAKSDLDGKPRWMIGVQLEPRVLMTKLPMPGAFVESVRQNVKSATMIFQFLRGIIERRMSPKLLNGPIQIARLSGDSARAGFPTFIGLMAMVSLNLAIFNLLPIP
ncbi:MAG: RIP metalloprotease RseP, partial [Acidobacteria bacterium]|nr:RIP metalloprotease RseP [Acidobacteriota bacterium]